MIWWSRQIGNQAHLRTHVFLYIHTPPTQLLYDAATPITATAAFSGAHIRINAVLKAETDATGFLSDLLPKRVGMFALESNAELARFSPKTHLLHEHRCLFESRSISCIWNHVPRFRFAFRRRFCFASCSLRLHQHSAS